MASFRKFTVIASGVAALAMPLGAPAASAQEVVQALPNPAQETLNDALRRLSRNPDSLPSLIAAGRASLELGDLSAAQTFLTRAQNIAPNDGRVLASLGMVAMRRGQPATAVQLFTNADRQGEPMAAYAADRGLAYDLVGRNDRAQRFYRQALSRDETPEVVRRLALSYAISGNAEASEAILLPLLQRQDRSAFRTRAFALAIAGRDAEAVAIAETMLPQRLSSRLAPYLRIMPRLTRAQQAAAANLGQFPDAAQMGRDTPEIAALSGNAMGPAEGQPGPAPAADRLEPQGETLGPATGTGVASTGELPAVSSAPTASTPPATAPARQPSTAATTVLAEQPDFPPVEAAQPSFSIAEPVAATPEPAPQQVELSEAFADFTLESAPVPSTAGAVDITAIEPAREAPPPAAPAPPAHPSRHWVQVATGQDVSAFRFDWRRIQRNAGDLLADADAFRAPWGQTNRLLTGPFDSAREAQAMVSALAGEGVDSFGFTSQEGEVIQSLD
ncbi:tetratricopeptide repeat protein [Aurantiacibacter gangjinensis]|uniref:tetratricopeptide repeat protein n=1 Tax=Aurantiacibacter gangjinensis TaxID=502682 RepID=UPI00090C511D|nr:tetratricopeptide repeat protein [Aurantiacibacter gangjinensis]APE27000.1 Tetratricopeptide repeat protein [Aurantiacibacter gangjinensis]